MDNRYLWDYCTQPMSVCGAAGNNCDDCPEKQIAEENKVKNLPQRPIAKK